MATKKKKKIIGKKKPLKKKPLKTKKPAPKKKSVKAKKKKVTKKPAAPKIEGKIIGTITHYFPHVRAGVIILKAPLKTGDTIRIKGHTTDFTQTVSSLQIDRVALTAAKKGDEIGLLVDSRVRRRDTVYKI